uniref:protein-serine/threonine phosphatase n=1 Tax=Panagrellus redivivus TaxID=6233 RepID=A0A7E4W3R9_PANRE
MSLLQRLQAAKNKLTKVDTVVTKPDGLVVVETRDKNGEFTRTDSADIPSEDGTVNLDGNPISNRRRKKVERLRRCGFVIDLKPDLQVAPIANGVFVSSQDVAQDYKLLTENGITHILNCATGIKNVFPKKFTYYNVELLDEPSANIKMHFKATNEFISNAVKGGGKVLIHCNAGISRSCTLAIAYVMWSEHKSYFDAFKQVKDNRGVCRPNDGFMRQLREYEDQLFRSCKMT